MLKVFQNSPFKDSASKFSYFICFDTKPRIGTNLKMFQNLEIFLFPWVCTLLCKIENRRFQVNSWVRRSWLATRISQNQIQKSLKSESRNVPTSQIEHAATFHLIVPATQVNFALISKSKNMKKDLPNRSS